jgi:hypothetical protein
MTAWVVRVVGFLIFLVCAWQMTHQDATGSPWPMAGVLGGVLLVALPSLPKAYIEQRNRIRGLRDGSYNAFLESEQRKNR